MKLRSCTGVVPRLGLWAGEALTESTPRRAGQVSHPKRGARDGAARGWGDYHCDLYVMITTAELRVMLR